MIHLLFPGIWGRPILLFPLILLTSCFYYKVATPKNGPPPPADSVIAANPNRYFILRSGSQAFHMKDLLLSEDRKTLSCTLDRLPREHQLHLTRGGKDHVPEQKTREGSMRYKRHKADTVVLHEVHLYIPPDSTAKVEVTYTLDLAQVQKVELLVKDKKRTTASHVGAALGIAGGVVAVVYVIAAAIALSEFSTGLSSAVGSIAL
ncbi:MAG TPA: hypothetical protein VG890_15705 [Puia sp.]|nr:hypothetical protein [Puia sp.]